MEPSIESILADLAKIKLRIATADERNDAVQFNLRAAELNLKAAALSNTPAEKASFRKECASLMDEAESIKSSKDWMPPAKHTENLAVAEQSAKPAVPIRKLVPPQCKRQLTTREKIVLVKGSKLNGFIFPPWEADPGPEDFETVDGKPFVDAPDLALSDHQATLIDGWRRAHEALPPPTWDVGNNDPAAAILYSARKVDLVQDAASDCSVVASLSTATARAESGHDWLIGERIWPKDDATRTPTPSANGKYVFKLNFNGCWRKVIVDDRLPVSKTKRLLHVVDRNRPAFMWPALVEKAYLKVRGGYDFPGSSSCSDLWALTGWIPEQLFLKADDLIPDSLWRRLYRAFEYGDVLITVGTGKICRKEEKARGLVSQHSYAVLAMRETAVDGRQFLVKNPWMSDKVWAKHGDKTQQVATADASEPLPTNSKWFSLSKIMAEFEFIYLNWNPGLFDNREDIHFEWKIEQSEAPVQHLIRSPQFSLRVDRHGTVWLLLSRHFKSHSESVDRSPTLPAALTDEEAQLVPADDPLGFTSIAVFAAGGEKLHIDEDCFERSPYVNTPQVLLRLDLQSATAVTVVVTEQDLPPSDYSFTLSAFAKSPMTLALATERYSHPAEIKGEWTADSAGGSTQSPTYAHNPQFRLEVMTPTALKALLQCGSPNIPIHVAVVHGKGNRVFDLRTRDIIAQSDSYRPSLATAEVKDLDAGVYTIICSTYEAKQLAPFILEVRGDSTCTLASIPREGAGMIPLKLSNVTFGTSQTKIAAPLLPRRQVILNINATFVKTRSLDPRHQHHAKSGLRVTLELGHGPDKKYVLVSGHGEFSDAKVLRTDKIDLPPGRKGRDLYLVLERLAGKNPGFEELYDVELWMDMPNGLQVGTWRGWDDFD